MIRAQITIRQPHQHRQYDIWVGRASTLGGPLQKNHVVRNGGFKFLFAIQLTSEVKVSVVLRWSDSDGLFPIRLRLCRSAEVGSENSMVHQQIRISRPLCQCLCSDAVSFREALVSGQVL